MTTVRHLIALLLVFAYTAGCVFGAAFVVCVEADGSHRIEAVAAECCAPARALPAASHDDRALAEADDSDCEDCQDHVPAVDVESLVSASRRTPYPSATAVGLAALPATVCSPRAALERSATRARAAPPPWSWATVALRSVIRRC